MEEFLLHTETMHKWFLFYRGQPSLTTSMSQCDNRLKLFFLLAMWGAVLVSSERKEPARQLVANAGQALRWWVGSIR
jgi:hypothetical protein